jgi:hypothetical protein
MQGHLCPGSVERAVSVARIASALPHTQFACLPHSSRLSLEVVDFLLQASGLMALLRNRPCLHLRSCPRPSVLQLPRPATCFQTVSAPAPVAQAPARTKQCPADRGALSICRAGLLGGSDVVADYTKELTEEVLTCLGCQILHNLCAKQTVLWLPANPHWCG